MAYPTRTEYMNKECTFAEFYTAVLATAGITKMKPCDLLTRAQASADPHLNDIPLIVWDRYAAAYQSSLARAFKAHGDFWSLSGGVCAVKQLVRNTLNQSA